MPTPQNTDTELRIVRDALLAIPRRDPLPEDAPAMHIPKRALSVREAALAPRVTLPAEKCAGRVLAAPALSCPPCIPIAVCGEVVDEGIIDRLRYYGKGYCEVIKQSL